MSTWRPLDPPPPKTHARAAIPTNLEALTLKTAIMHRREAGGRSSGRAELRRLGAALAQGGWREWVPGAGERARRGAEARQERG